MLMQDNTKEVTAQRVENIFKITKRTIDLLMDQVDEGVLKNIKSTDALEQFQKDVDTVIASKMKNKFKL